ncbi:hypothetical protein [Parasphaerochaeta coccoides]|uniref:Lipoprotein n=1 Tax=Parasphaerochaeta coccoides (strain ATCC BAA-1237 / DSM 17374 / SPN1) TaxID=760011 RepID=F4GHC8_PARC1|nr:hypothetical protein [Parasphaerochaeta coccoides]AEC02027.1 hypothetical protein Spico_0802 [Parasphaerochaeta coccoides DSM 17374]
MKKVGGIFLVVFSILFLAGCPGEPPVDPPVYPWAGFSRSETIDPATILGEVNELTAWYDHSIYDEQMSAPSRSVRTIDDLTEDTSDRTAEQAVVYWVLDEEDFGISAKINDILYPAHSFDELDEILVDLGVLETDTFPVNWWIGEKTDLVTGEKHQGAAMGYGVDTIGFKPAVASWDTDLTVFFNEPEYDYVRERFVDGEQVIELFFTRELPRWRESLSKYMQSFSGLWISTETGEICTSAVNYALTINSDGYAVIDKIIINSHNDLVDTPLAGTITDYIGAE